MTDALMKAQAHLTDRDHVLLDWLYDHGVLTTPQIAHALYPSLDFAQKRLTKLVALAVIDRFRPQRPVGGSYPFHYVLDQLGTDIVLTQRPDEEPPRRGQARARRWSLTNRTNLPHLLGVNGFFTDLAGHARTHPGSALERWWSTSQTIGPGRFRDTPGVSTYSYLPVRPDGHGIWTEHDHQVAFWLEYDTGTESLTTLTEKVTTYSTRLTGGFGGLRSWPLLFTFHSSGRQLHFHQRLAHQHPRVPVASTARDPHTRQSPAEDIWWLHNSRGRHRLADLPDAVAAQSPNARPDLWPEPPRPPLTQDRSAGGVSGDAWDDSDPGDGDSGW